MTIHTIIIYVCIGFITGHCQIRSLTTIWNRSQPGYCGVCCDEQELETVQHLLCNCLPFGKLRLRTLGMGFFEGLNSVSRANIKALRKFISGLGWLRSAGGFISVVAFSLFLFCLFCVIPPLPFLAFLPPLLFPIPSIIFLFKRTSGYCNSWQV